MKTNFVKSILVLVAFAMYLLPAFGQSPEKMSYQAVIRNSSDALVTNTQLGMQISILQGSPTGTVVYTETQTPTTNSNGLVSIEIGCEADFDAINWAEGPYFIEVKTDIEGGNNYTITGTSQLLSVPYALYAKEAATVAEIDPIFTTWDKSTGISITESQIADLGNYIETETDPVFTTWDKSTGISITESQIADLGDYIETETDPVFTAWDKSTGISITESQISDLGNYIITETQNLADVLAMDNSANAQIKNLTDPSEAQDAATKAYVDELEQKINLLEIALIDAGLLTSFIDRRDGTEYGFVKIGNQFWMAENLKYLPSVVGSSTGSNTVPYYYVYGYNGTDINAAKATSNYETYGVLYNWPAAMAACPTGWHLPSDDEWNELTNYLGGNAGGKLKEVGTTHWNSPNTGATNETGFTALPGGFRIYSGIFDDVGSIGYWWSATEYETYYAWYRDMRYNDSSVLSFGNTEELGLSVRCVKD